MKNYSCPYCGHSALTKYGKVKNIQRYKCKTCKRTFRETHGTPLFRLHKVKKIEKYLKALRLGMSVRKAAKYVGISAPTSFTWRHKFLSSLKPKEFIDCNESDANMQVTTMEYSAKGRKKAPEKNQEPTKTLITQRQGQLCLYKLDSQKPAKNASEILRQSRIPNYIVGVASKLLNSAIKHAGDNKKVDLPSIVKESKNELCKQLHELNEWMERFKGVASKYLQQYWNWYLTLNNLKSIINNNVIFAERCCTERNLDLFERLKSQ